MSDRSDMGDMGDRRDGGDGGDTHEPHDMSHNGHRAVDPAGQAPLAQPSRVTNHTVHAHQDEWVAAYAAHELNANERAVFARHLGVCASCQAALAQTQRIRALLGGLALPALALDDAAQPTDAADLWAAPADQPPSAYPEPSRPSSASEWAGRPVSLADRVSLPDARPADAAQGALADDGLRARPPGRLATGANAPYGRRGATGAMDPTTHSGDARPQPFANRFDDPADDDSRRLTGQQSGAPITPPTQTPRRRRPSVALAATLLLIALAAGVFGALRSRHGSPGTGAAPSPTVSHVGAATPAPTPAPTGAPIDPQTGLPQGVTIAAIQMLSATDGWAAGSLTVNNGMDGIILRYTGARWKVAKTFPGLRLTSIYMISDTNGWAVSGGYPNQGQGATSAILHDQDGVWRSSANLTNEYLSQVVMVSPTEGWIIGLDTSTKAGSVIWHIQNSVWTQEPNSLMAIAGVSMASATSGWIVGNDGTIGHYQNGTWSQWSQTAIGPLNAVQMLSATDGWAVGLKSITNSDGVTTDPYIIQYNGSFWREVTEPTVPGGGQINAISMDSPTDGWAVGQLQGQTGPVAPGLLFHYHNGRWVSVPFSIGVDLVAVSMVSATDGWAVGSTYGANGSPILHYGPGGWSPYRA